MTSKAGVDIIGSTGSVMPIDQMSMAAVVDAGELVDVVEEGVVIKKGCLKPSRTGNGVRGLKRKQTSMA